MHISSYSHMLPLGWLPLTAAAREDGFLPVHRRLRSDGHEVVDKWGYLDPDLHWRQGRGMGEPALEGARVLELLRASAEEASHHASPHEKSRSPCEWSPEKFARRIPDVETLAQAWFNRDLLTFKLTAPTLPTFGTRSEWLAALPQLLPLQYRPRLGLLMRDPARLFRVGFQMLCSEWAIHGHGRRQTGEALVVMGIGALGIFPRVRCSVCYRLAMPATTRCARHSQTKSIRVDANKSKIHAQISSESRLAKRVMAKLGWTQNDLVTDRGYDGFVEEKTIGGLLWGLRVGDGGYTKQHLKDGLDAGHFPRVRALLPSRFCDLDDARACASLRRHIDPSEWVVSYWFTRVAAAEAWLDAADALLPGRAHMKPSAQNRERVSRARVLLRQGLSQKDIAVQLGVSQSHLSHLLRRLE